MSEPFLGQITVFPYSFPPNGWADCAGQLLPISQNAALFSLLGTAYGGNGQTTFALPDLQGRVPIGQGQSPGGSPYAMGDTGGAESVSLNGTEASHSHSLSAITAHGSTNEPSGQLLAAPIKGGLHSSTKGNIYNAAAADTALARASILPAGGSQPHNNIQPSLVVRYCIALQGIYPSRG